MKMSRVRFLPRALCLGLFRCRPCGNGVRKRGAGTRTRAGAWWVRENASREVSMLSEFKKFVLRGNVVDLAVAVVVGVAFTAMITAFVADLITPLIAAIFGKPSFSNLSFELHGSTFKYGSLLHALLSI